MLLLPLLEPAVSVWRHLIVAAVIKALTPDITIDNTWRSVYSYPIRCPFLL